MPREPLSYHAAVAELGRLIDYERQPPGRATTRRFHLAAFRHFLARLENPQRSFRVIHIAGTRGKGTTATLLAEALHHRGFCAGLYRSPHVDDLRERISVDNVWISRPAFARHAARTLELIRENPARADGAYRTFFECLTAIAFLHFAERGVDWAVIETGLGGRLDATNVVEPELTILTALGMDHAAVLGPRPEDIAREKAGILKRGVPCVIAAQPAGQPQEVMQVVRRKASSEHVSLHFVEQLRRWGVEERSPEGMTLKLMSRRDSRPARRVHVPGVTGGQAQALASVDVALEALSLPRLSDGERFAWTLAGRFEILRRRPLIVLDGAHCSLAGTQLAEAVRAFGHGPLRVCLAMMADKDHAGFVRSLGLGPADAVALAPLATPRAIVPGALAEVVQRETGAEARVFRSLPGALRWLRGLTPRGSLIVTGSFYHLAPARRCLHRMG